MQKRCNERMIYMLCQACGKKEATFHYTSNENGKITEMHLCHDCAKKNGYYDESIGNFDPFNLFGSSEKMFGELLGGMFGNDLQNLFVSLRYVRSAE